MLYSNRGNPPLLKLLPPSVRTVIDVGCGAGDNARLLTQAGMRVWGVTVSPEEATAASAWCERVVIADLDDDATPLASLPAAADALLLSHVLEHLRRPEQALRTLVGRLRPGGWVAAAVPNMAFWRARLRLLRGDWSREATGHFDRTHVQFWSYLTAPAPFAGLGLQLEHQGGVFSVPSWPIRRVAPRFSRLIDEALGPRRPNLFASQVLLLYRKVAEVPPPPRAEQAVPLSNRGGSP